MFRTLLCGLLLALMLGLPGAGRAHATIVLGQFTVQPASLEPSTEATLRLSLEDPAGYAIEDAIVFAELRPVARPDAQPLRADFSEASPGVYTSTLALPRTGEFIVFLRDQTYPQEEANATLGTPLRVGGGLNAPQSFNFPPTATGAAGWRTWLIWIIVIPIAAALLVTVLVLTRSDDPKTPREAKKSS